MAVAITKNETRDFNFRGGRKMKKALTMVGIILLVAAIAVPVLAQGPGWGRGRGRGMGMGFTNRVTPYCESIPNLSAEQSARLKELREQRAKEVLPLQNELISKRVELRRLWLQANPDEAKIKAKQHEITELENKLREKMTEYRLECHKILTPEQQAQLQAFWPRKYFGYGARRPGARGYGRMRAW